MEVVLIGWGDAHREFNHDDHLTGRPIEAESVGWLVEVSPEAIVICGTNYEDGEKTEYETIPLGMVRFVRFAPSTQRWRNSHRIVVDKKIVWKG